MCNFYNKSDYALKRDVFELNNVMRPEDGMKFIRCDNDDESGNYDLFEESCKVNGNDSGERFINVYLEAGDGDEPDFIQDTLELENKLDQYKIFSYVVHSRKRALGTQDVISGGFTSGNNLDLINDPPELYKFDQEHYSHSRQFRSNIINERWYWERVMNTGDLESCL